MISLLVIFQFKLFKFVTVSFHIIFTIVDGFVFVLVVVVVVANNSATHLLALVS